MRKTTPIINNIREGKSLLEMVTGTKGHSQDIDIQGEDCLHGEFQKTFQKTCEECEGRGIFYFTGEDSLYDSMVCGKCHGVGNHQVTEQSKTCINCGKDFFGCDEQCETCDIQDWRGY